MDNVAGLFLALNDVHIPIVCIARVVVCSLPFTRLKQAGVCVFLVLTLRYEEYNLE